MGLETADDAGVYLLNEETALVQTVDFFTPIVDDPYTFGAIAAANALSDIYAMGGQPLTALNIMAFPLDTLPKWVMAEILKGGTDKIHEAGAALLGGHSIQDKEPKYGLAVTGTAKPGQIWTNAGAQAGDALVLTKPLGIGIITTALRKKHTPEGKILDQSPVAPETEKKAIEVMMRLNALAADAAKAYAIHGCTDITGFGLLGHGWEMAKASGVSLEIEMRRVPVLAGAAELARQGYVAGGNHANLQYLADKAEFNDALDMTDKYILADPITSGGLLLALPEAEAADLAKRLHGLGIAEAAVVGRVRQGKPGIKVLP